MQRRQESSSSADTTAGSVITGDVVVLRAPTLHRDEIRVLKAVENEHIAAFLRETSAGILFFSTQGSRSAADEMVGSDLDGVLPYSY